MHFSASTNLFMWNPFLLIFEIVLFFEISLFFEIFDTYFLAFPIVQLPFTVLKVDVVMIWCFSIFPFDNVTIIKTLTEVEKTNRNKLCNSNQQVEVDTQFIHISTTVQMGGVINIHTPATNILLSTLTTFILDLNIMKQHSISFWPQDFNIHSSTKP